MPKVFLAEAFQRGGLALVAGLTLAGAAMAQSAPQVDEPPAWARKPSGETTARAYPAEALDRTIAGGATIDCAINLDGRAEDCRIESEAPWGLGFGDAAVKLIQAEGRFKPATLAGKPVAGGRMSIPLKFAPPELNGRYIIFRPIFSRAPSLETVNRAWPMGSDAADAVVVLRCSLRADGGLKDCKGAGKAEGAFYEAARSLSGEFQVRLSPEDARMVGRADVLVPIRFLSPATVEGRSTMVTDPWWTTSVNPEKVLSVYPARAAEAGIRSGRGVADCLVAADGKLTDCKVARERPGDMGFGASAVAIAQLMQMNPWSQKGRPVVGARIKLPIDFNLAEEPAPSN